MFTKKRSILLLLILFLGCPFVFSEADNDGASAERNDISLYHKLQLSHMGLKEDIFSKALTGWMELAKTRHLDNTDFLSIADLSQSSNLKRLYVIDLKRKVVLFNTYVAHGRNSGEEFAHVFSNKPDSYQSSLGFYVTSNTYEGQHGLSMKLIGLEKGINDIAEQRGIVMHGAPYVSEEFCCQYGRLGRSQGCPAVPENLCEPIVNTIKDGSCLFMFYPDSAYFKKSVIL